MEIMKIHSRDFFNVIFFDRKKKKLVLLIRIKCNRITFGGRDG